MPVSNMLSGSIGLCAIAAASAAALWRSEELRVYARDGMRRQPQAPLGSYVALPTTPANASDRFLGEALSNVNLWRESSREIGLATPSPIVLEHYVEPSLAERVLLGRKMEMVRYDIESRDFDRLIGAARESRAKFVEELVSCAT